MKTQESARKTAWRHRKGRSYADARNEKVREYQSTFVGMMALRAGRLNTASKYRGTYGRVSGGDLVELWARQNGIELSLSVKCAICGKVTQDWCIDHITSIKSGGENRAQNLQMLCKACHKEKTKQDVDAYKEQPLLFDLATT